METKYLNIQLIGIFRISLIMLSGRMGYHLRKGGWPTTGKAYGAQALTTTRHVDNVIKCLTERRAHGLQIAVKADRGLFVNDAYTQTTIRVL